MSCRTLVPDDQFSDTASRIWFALLFYLGSSKWLKWQWLNKCSDPFHFTQGIWYCRNNVLLEPHTAGKQFGALKGPMSSSRPLLVFFVAFSLHFSDNAHIPMCKCSTTTSYPRHYFTRALPLHSGPKAGLKKSRQATAFFPPLQCTFRPFSSTDMYSAVEMGLATQDIVNTEVITARSQLHLKTSLNKPTPAVMTF